MSQPIRVRIWNEYRHERENPAIAQVYPDGIHAALAQALSQHDDLRVATSTLDEPEHGLTQAALDETDVLLWWGHKAHAEVEDAVVQRVYDRVQRGMGLIALHSAHFSKIFQKLMGTDCTLVWREAGEKERVWVVAPSHPIAQGVSPYFEIPQAEMYGEFFNIPEPDTLVFISWFAGGEVFRSGCCYQRGGGKVFYFRPGHETYPIYHQAEVLRVIANAVRWAAPLPMPAEMFEVVNRKTMLEQK